MQDLNKVNVSQYFGFWKSLTIGLLVLIVTILLSIFLPHYFSPMIALLGAAFLYTMLYNGRLASNTACMVVPYTLFYGVLMYSFVSISINVLDIWGVIHLPKEFSFFNSPYLVSIILNPVCFLVSLVIYLRNSKLALCIDCKVKKGLSYERGKLGEILHQESRLQLRNLVVLFGVLSVIVYIYYLFFYVNVNINGRDRYMFVWICVFAYLGMEIYVGARYYNMYLDLKENGEIITEEELNDMTTKTYLRFYVICGNDIFLNLKVADSKVADTLVIDTPFVTKRNVNGITAAEVDGIIRKMCGVTDGRLRFFFGRKSPDMIKHRLLRYFYFLPGKAEEYPDLNVDGEWLNFELLKKIYNDNPTSLARIFRSDLSRITTIVLTQKLFDDRGFRRNKLKSYLPTYDLVELAEKDYDFQDDKWIRVAMFNSDTKGFHIRRWFRKLTGRNMTARNADKGVKSWEQGQ